MICQCGCGKEIKQLLSHKYRMPIFISGHNRKGQKHSEEAKKKVGDAHRRKIVLKCEACNTDFITIPSNKIARYCSMKCRNVGKKNQKLTEEHKDKISESMKGKFVGRIMSEEQKRLLSKIRKGKPILNGRGEKSHFWKGGVSKNKEHIAQRQRIICHNRRARIKGNGGSFTKEEWELIKRKFRYSCPACGSSGIKLTIDHIVPIIKGGTNNISNIQPLCGPCNIRKHANIRKYSPNGQLEMVI